MIKKYKMEKYIENRAVMQNKDTLPGNNNS